MVLNQQELECVVNAFIFQNDECPFGSWGCKLAIKLIKELLQECHDPDSKRFYLEQLKHFESEYENQMLQEQEN